MANYEKQVEQEAAYPIPISLYNCYRTVRHEKRGIAILLIAFLMPHCPVTVVQRYRDGVCSLLFHLFFIVCHPYIPLHLVVLQIFGGADTCLYNYDASSEPWNGGIEIWKYEDMQTWRYGNMEICKPGDVRDGTMKTQRYGNMKMEIRKMEN